MIAELKKNLLKIGSVQTNKLNFLFHISILYYISS